MAYDARSGTLFHNLSGMTFRKARPEVTRNTARPQVQDGTTPPRSPERSRRQRVDAQRNIDSLLQAAKVVFDTSGVDAPAKQIADLAGVGVGTLYRHFPRRSDLVVAVVEHEVDACADAARTLSAAHAPGEALANWLHRYTAFLAIKPGLATALHSGDPAYDELPDYFMQRLEPVLGSLLQTATASGEVRGDISPKDLLYAVASLCLPVADEGLAYSQRMVALLINGLATSRPAPKATEESASVSPDRR